jgi:hypothetical protein
MTYSIYKNLVLQDERSKKLNFKPDGREHYVYRITDYTRTEKEHYYGSHTPEKGKKYNSLIEEFWTYKTSSKYNVLNENKKENYKVKILKVFDNPADKIIYEAFLHQYFNVKLSNKFWNKSNQTAFGYDTTGCEPWNKGKTGLGGYRHSGTKRVWSEDHKRKLSSKMIGHKKSNTENYSISSKDMVVVVDDKGNKTKIKREDWNKDTHRSIMEGSLTATNIKTNIKTRVSKFEFDNNKLLIANGSKWFYEINGMGYRNSDLPKLMESLNISCSVQTYKKKIKKINLQEYSLIVG